MTGVLVRRGGDTGTHREDEDDWSDAATNPGVLRIAGSQKKIRRNKEGVFPRAFKGNWALLIP